MLFNSIDFALFLPICFVLYWFVFNKNLKVQNTFVLLASYLFYGWWDWRFLSLILFSGIVDYFIGINLQEEKNERKRKLLLYTSIFINLGFLGVFKYYNFFIDSLTTAFSFLGSDIQISSLNIILPVGISFYTFQTLSYSIDIYNKKLTATRDFFAFTAFVSFFPQLVAGPIERASNLLPQFQKSRKFDYKKSIDGLQQMLWGLFKKIVIADNCADNANYIFNNSDTLTGSTLVLGALFFAFQIYGDFSGYSDIAIGTSRLFGFDLKQNFAFPYFSRDIAEFWRRWHISLSTWFRDYLYIPLGGSKVENWKKIRNTFIIFIVSGFWHGANWTFLIWGFLNALYFLPLLLRDKNRQHLNIVAYNKTLPTLKEVIGIFSTFALTTFAWIFFRAESVSHAFSYISTIFSKSLFAVPQFEGMSKNIFILLILFLGIEWLGRHGLYALQWNNKIPKSIKWLASVVIAIIILENINLSQSQEFIYFDF